MRLLCRWRACLSDIESAGAVTVKMPPAITDGFFPATFRDLVMMSESVTAPILNILGAMSHLKIRAVNFHITGHHPAVD